MGEPTLKLQGKKGACFTFRQEGKKGSWVENLPKVLALRPFWNYSWGVDSLGDRQPECIDFLPMVWGYYPKQFETCLSKIIQQNPSMALTFNEPDGKNQSNISVEQAIHAWPSFESLPIPLVSPSCVHPDKEWMTNFMALVKEKNLRVDVIGVHSYGNPNAKNFKNKLLKTYNLYQRPLLITEFAIADWKAKKPEDNKFTTQQVLHFMQAVLPWLEEQSWIVGYSWFSFFPTSPGGCCSALFDQEGNLTECGSFYAQFQPNPLLQLDESKLSEIDQSVA